MNLQNKTCIMCHIEKSLNDFNKRKESKDGYRNECKECRKKRMKFYCEKNEKVYKEKRKIYYQKNKNNILEKSKIYYENNKIRINARSKEYHKLNKEILNEKSKQYYIDHRDILTEKMKTTSKKYYDKNKKYILKQSKIYYEKNKRQKMDKRNIYRNKKNKRNPVFLLSNRIRTIIYLSLKKQNYIKQKHTHDILGCSFNDFKNFIESKFEIWMNWKNYGKYNGEFNYGWDIDHIIPVSSGNTEEEIIKLNHYTNLQPLCSKINRDIKKNKQFNSTSTY